MFSYFLHLMRCLNCWDNKNFWGVKFGQTSPATSVNIQYMCKTSITCNNDLFSQRKNSPADKQTYLYRLRIDQIASETIQPELYSICSISITVIPRLARFWWQPKNRASWNSCYASQNVTFYTGYPRGICDILKRSYGFIFHAIESIQA